VKRDLLVGVAQWLSAPREPTQNLSIALGMIEAAATRGVEVLVLPELWSCGYDPETLAEDVRRDAEPREGPRSQRLADAARRHNLFLAAGTVPELGDDGQIHDTALVFDPRGGLCAWHRKAHLYRPTREQTVFVPGDRLTTFDDPMLGRVGLVVGFDGDFPEVARALALRGARLVLAPSASEVEGATAWDLLQPALALTNSQWWIQANQAGSHSSSTLLGASRIIAPTGTVVVQASSAVPGRVSPAELLVHRIDLHLAYRREGISALLEDERRPDLYTELVDRIPTAG
jgi:predicted amidohydrolase